MRESPVLFSYYLSFLLGVRGGGGLFAILQEKIFTHYLPLIIVSLLSLDEIESGICDLGM